MRSEADRLLEDVEHIRSNAGTVGPDHSQVRKLVTEVRGFLSREGNTKGLKRFEQLELVKGGSEMWSQYEIDQRSLRKYKNDLEKLETILREMGAQSGPSDESSADQKMRELFLTPEQETPQEQSNGETEGEVMKEPLPAINGMDQKVEPNFGAITKKHLSASAREQTIDGLMAELNTEMKSADPDWEKIQKIMADLLGLRKTGDLLDRLKAEVKSPDVTWENVREILAQLWSVNKDIVVDLLPTLLKS